MRAGLHSRTLLARLSWLAEQRSDKLGRIAQAAKRAVLSLFRALAALATDR